jgi:hypothetical protein
MSQIYDWKVIREHQGDRFYNEGETRQGTEAELGHLVPRVLVKLGPAGEKAEASPLNKAESAAPANKAATGRKVNKKA